MNKDQADILSRLTDLRTVRAQSACLSHWVAEGHSAFWQINPAALDEVAEQVAMLTRHNYPNLDVPAHSRWRHFEVGGFDRIQAMGLLDLPLPERLRCQVELVIISVLLDAGAGPDWRYQELATGQGYQRSEGLAIASLDLYASGCLSRVAQQPWRVDAEALINLSEAQLAEALQVSVQNPLLGLSGRLHLLKQLGRQITLQAEGLGEDARLGLLADRWLLAGQASLPLQTVFGHLLDLLNPIWPSRLSLDGIPLGDVWTHPALQQASLPYIPFHKLTQWLTYSLLEPLREAGLVLTETDALTGLPEYRNGGLLIDGAVLLMKDHALSQHHLLPGHAAIVEWRALTVSLLDDLAIRVRKILGRSAAELPLASVLQGGTWQAGRAMAAALRPAGRPPLQIDSDGTVF